jgi:fumarylacetoacetate (FAA) hydrolase
MRLVNYDPLEDGETGLRLGAVIGDTILDVREAWSEYERQERLTGCSAPTDIPALLSAPEPVWEALRSVVAWSAADRIRSLSVMQPHFYPLDTVQLGSPVPRPPSVRDFYAFESHVKTAREIRGQQIAAEWYQFPVFYFSNPGVIFGPGEVIPYPLYTRELDYELEIACIIGRAGRDLTPQDALQCIAGYTILNDWSARDVQRLETRVGLGPAKAKDFATSLGPMLVTPDELADLSTGRPGVFNLPMQARVNGRPCSSGNMSEMYFSFGEMLARASEAVELRPGDVIGSGTVGTGSLLEVTRGEGPWLMPGDQVELEIERLGVLANQVGELTVSPRKG